MPFLKSIILVLFFFHIPLFSQSNLLLKNAIIHTGTGDVIKSGQIEIRNGIITKIDSNHLDSTGLRVIDIGYQHVYPGLIVPYSTVGLRELDAVRATLDYSETGELNPNVRSIIAYNTDSELIGTLRSNGILFAQTTPMSGLISGQSSVVALQGWNWEEAAYKTDIAIHMNWPIKFIGFGWWEDAGQPKKNEAREKELDVLETIFKDAYSYYQTKVHAITNLKLEAMRGLFDGSKKLFIYADNSKDIIESVLFSQRYGVKNIVIVGAHDSEKAISFLAQQKIPVVFTRTHTLPANTYNSVDQVYNLPTLFKKAGIVYCLSYIGDMEVMGTRNLAFTAGSTVNIDLNKEEALKSITLNTAKILGIDNTTGSIEIGKEANIVVSKGDILDVKSNEITLAYIKGIEINLGDKHKNLYKKYAERYNLK